MKFYQTTFTEYLNQVNKMNLHPELKPLMGAEGPPRNIIFHGPSGVGKYSQALSYLMSYSPSQLQHYKKVKFVMVEQEVMQK